MKWILISLWMVFLFFTATRSKTTCEAPPVRSNQPAAVTCLFDFDVGQKRIGVMVYKTTKTNAYSDVIKCIWIKTETQPNCYPNPGYSSNRQLTRTLVVNITSASKEHVGDYVCQPIPSDPRDLESCTLRLLDTEQNTIKGKNDSKEHENEDTRTTESRGASKEHDNTRAIITGSVSWAIFVGVVAGVLIFKRRKKLPCRRQERPLETTDQEATTNEKIRVLIVGQQGVGKSSLGNLLCGEKAFSVGKVPFSSETKECASHTVSKDGREYLVVDTPGVCEWDTSTQEKEKTMNVYRELVKGGAFTASGPHVILVVFECGRFSNTERDSYRTLKKLFGEQMCKYTIIVFTRLDYFNTTKNPARDLESQRAALESALSAAPENLLMVCEEAGRRHFGINNTVKEDEQRDDLITKITQLYDNNQKSHYISEFLTGIYRGIDNEIEKRMEENCCQPDERP